MGLSSLKSRLCLSIIPLLVIIVITVAWLAHGKMEDVLYAHIDGIIQAKCNGILSIINTVSEATEQKRIIDDLMGNHDNESKTLYWLWNPGEHRVTITNATHEESEQPWLISDPHATSAYGVQDYLLTSKIQGSEYRIIRRSIHPNHEPYVLFVAYCSQSLHDQLHPFLWFLYGLGSLVVLVAIALALGAVMWTLRPVNRAADLLKHLSWSDTNITDIDRLNVPLELTVFKTALADMLARLDQFVDRQKQFTANAAHELRTPITLAKNSAQTALYQTNRTQSCQKTLNDIIADMDRMTGLIDQLQMLSSLDEAKELPDTTILSLDGLLQKVVQSYQSTSPDQIRFPNSFPASLQGDTELLQSLFTNLIDNALIHGPANRPVTIQMISDSNDKYVSVEIRDEGGHIPAEDISRLTERFFRTDSSRDRHTGGSGLGLTIAHEIVKKHNGHLAIQSEPATGTCVRVQLPVCS